MRTRVKICCMQSVDEARMAIECGADAIGLVSAMPSGPGPITEELIADIAAAVPPAMKTFLLTCLSNADEIAAQHRRCGTTTIQLCDELPLAEYAKLRALLAGISIVQVIHVRGDRSVDEAQAAAAHVDALLLDSGNPSLAVKQLGGTGRVHDWALSRRIRDSAGIPVWLAGGLNPSNVRNAIEAAEPFGVDVCSGLRPHGALDRTLLQQFVTAVRGEER